MVKDIINLFEADFKKLRRHINKKHDMLLKEIKDFRA